ncbi:hypothetical protein QJS66_16055 [Kocuria rhizophila]|nr:hypothetical protein QJS66_16055 [Kocuria rhizophila]
MSASADQKTLKKLTDTSLAQGEPKIFATNVLTLVGPRTTRRGSRACRTCWTRRSSSSRARRGRAVRRRGQGDGGARRPGTPAIRRARRAASRRSGGRRDRVRHGCEGGRGRGCHRQSESPRRTRRSTVPDTWPEGLQQPELAAQFVDLAG